MDRKASPPRSAARPAPQRAARPRKAASGDIAPVRSATGIETHVVGEAVEAAQNAKKTAVQDILAHAGLSTADFERLQ